MYHRIAEELIDPWELAVAPTRFEEQLEVLRRTRRPLRLTDFISGLMDGSLPPNAVAVTFDDGYIDNLHAARPLLAAADVPATVFLVSDYLGRSERFWWDELTKLILSEGEPRSIELEVRGIKMRFKLEGIGAAWRASSGPVSARQRAYLEIWQTLRTLEDDERRTIIRDMQKAFAIPDLLWKAARDRPMTSDEVRFLANDGLVTIGAHTATHPALTTLPDVALCREIVKSKATCEALADAKVIAFAYPYGDFDNNVRKAVRAAGFSCACSTRSGPVHFASDLLALPRLQVKNWQGDAFEYQLRSASRGR